MKLNFWEIQDANYLEMEESTAVIFENIVLENKIPLISPIVPLTIAGEIFNEPKDLQNFISGYLKLIWKYKENDEITRFYRLKQCYPFKWKWVWRKWVVYTTWIPKVLEFIEKWQAKKVFLWAFSYETLKNTKNIEEQLETIIQPVLIAEILKYIIDNNLVNEIINWKPIATKKLIKHLQEKYWQFWINIKNEIHKLNKLKRENKNKLPEIKQNTRSMLIEILNTFKEE
jgi:hypothetical protein